MELNIKEIQAYANDLLRELSRVCKECNLTYYIAYGSLLGTVRHTGNIPWDSDVDIWVPEKEYEYFLSQLEIYMSKDCWIDYRSQGRPRRCFARLGKKGYDTTTLHIDIFRLANLSDNKIKRFFQIQFGPICIHARTIKAFPIEHFSKRKRKIVWILKLILYPFSNDFFVKLYDKLSKVDFEKNTKYVASLSVKNHFPREWFGQPIEKKYEDFQVLAPCNVDAILKMLYGDYMKYPSESEIIKALNYKYSIKEIKK